MALLDAGIEPVECETEGDYLNVSVNYIDTVKAKDVIEKVVPNVDYEIDESGWYAKNLVELNDEDMDLFNRLYSLLDNIDDVTDIYHNVKIDS